MTKMLGRIISSSLRINPRQTLRLHPILRRLVKEKANEDVRPAVEKGKEKVKEKGKADPILGSELIPLLPVKAVIRAKTIELNASRSAGTNALIAKRTANVVTSLSMKKTSRNVTHGKQNAIGKVTCPMQCLPPESEDPS